LSSKESRSSQLLHSVLESKDFVAAGFSLR